jgi:hypothetical protein
MLVKFLVRMLQCIAMYRKLPNCSKLQLHIENLAIQTSLYVYLGDAVFLQINLNKISKSNLLINYFF